jgi:hypothetical protein
MIDYGATLRTHLHRGSRRTSWVPASWIEQTPLASWASVQVMAATNQYDPGDPDASLLRLWSRAGNAARSGPNRSTEEGWTAATSSPPRPNLREAGPTKKKLIVSPDCLRWNHHDGFVFFGFSENRQWDTNNSPHFPIACAMTTSRSC